MGRTVTPTFALTLRVPGFYMTPSGWDCKRQGRPSDATLAAAVEMFEASTRPGGCNAHLGTTVVSSAKVVRQSTGDVVAEYRAAAFVAVA